MAYSEELAQRVRGQIEGKDGFVEKKMFGGICWLLTGNMACGIIRDELIVRVSPERYHESLALPHTREFDVTGRPMKGWVMVAADDYDTDENLAFWLEQGIAFAATLPPK